MKRSLCWPTSLFLSFSISWHSILPWGCHLRSNRKPRGENDARKREKLHEHPYTEIVKLTIRLVSGLIFMRSDSDLILLYLNYFHSVHFYFSPIFLVLFFSLSLYPPPPLLRALNVYFPSFTEGDLADFQTPAGLTGGSRGSSRFQALLSALLSHFTVWLFLPFIDNTCTA